MNSIKLPINFEGSKGNKTLKTLMENQTIYSLIDVKYAIQLGELTTLRKPKTVLNANKLIEINQVVLLDFYVNNLCFSDEFMVVPNLSESVIFGQTTIRKWRIQLDFKTNSVSAKAVQFKL
jgi:hypothetical protein